MAALVSAMAFVWKATRNGAVQSESKHLVGPVKGGIESNTGLLITLKVSDVYTEVV